MKCRQLMLALCAVLCGLRCLAQDITDVEEKPYGSYTGGSIDTIDLATGNLILHIPLVSFPQRGALPPLSFSVELNNAPYTQSMVYDPGTDGTHIVTSRYDTSPPGALYQQPGGGGVQQNIHNMGAYITSSFSGGVATGQVNVNGGVAALQYNVIDPGGATHVLESDGFSSASWNTYRAPDGTGYSFIPSYTLNGIPSGSVNSYDPWSDIVGTGYETSNLNWITYPETTSGIRVGTVYSPTGIQYTSAIQSYAVPPGDANEAAATNSTAYAPRALFTVAKDPSGNRITRGPWYWSGYLSIAGTASADIQQLNNSHPPVYVDSVGRTIPDIVTLQATTDAPSIPWIVPGINGTPVTYTINYTAVGNSGEPYSGQWPDPAINTQSSGSAIQSIALPNGTKWTFSYYYDGAPDLQSVTLPTGGSISYTYTPTQLATNGLTLSRCNAVCHAVQTRTEYDYRGHITSFITYSYGTLTNVPNCSIAFYTTETDSIANNDTVHIFCALGGLTGSSSLPANTFHEIETDYYQGPSSSGTRLKKVLTNFEYQWDITPVFSSSPAGLINVLPSQITTTTPAGSSTEVMEYSADSSPAQVNPAKPLFSASRIWCRGPGTCSPYPAAALQHPSIPAAPVVSYVEPTTESIYSGTTVNEASLLRTTATAFQFANPAYMAANFIALTQSVQSAGPTGSGTGTVITNYGYDEENGSPQGVFGNQTSRTETYDISGGVTSTGTRTVYNSQGMPITKFDANSNATTINYDSTGLYPGSIQGPTTNGIAHIDYYSYDLNTGVLNWHTDENGSGPDDGAHTTTYAHDDVMGRVTGISQPGGGGSSFCYTDLGGLLCSKAAFPPYSLFTSTTASPDPPVLTEHDFDGLGRLVKSSVLSDPMGGIPASISYDSQGRVSSRTTPSGATTSYTYDALGRKTIQTQPDRSLQQWCYDGLPTTEQTNTCSSMAYGISAASWTDITDETGRHTQQVFDALGRLVTVMEPEPVLGALGMETDYTYDAFDDLEMVNQFGLAGSTAVKRWFNYDIPSRVVWAYNPETMAPGLSGPGITYSYDGNSNLIQRIDNRGITTNYTYDALNRLTSKTYLNSDNSYATSSACYQYDGPSVSNGIGRLAAQWTQMGPCPASPSSGGVQTESAISAYDTMGRVTDEWRCLSPTNCASGAHHVMRYTYDLAGNPLSYRGSALGITGSLGADYDGAGHVQDVNSIPTNGTMVSLFSLPSYTPEGALSGAQLGSSLTMSRTFDVRQRVTSETDSGGLSVSPQPGSALMIINGWEQAQ